MRSKRVALLVVGAGAALVLGGVARSSASHGALSFARARQYTTSRTNVRLDGFAAADLNGDGSPDLVTADSYRAVVRVLLNRRDGTLRQHVDYPIKHTANGMGLAVADLNGDERPDLVVFDFGPSTVSVLLNRGDGTFLPRVDYRTGKGPSDIVVADVNGDGSADLVTTNETTDDTDSVSVLLNLGNGSFAPKQDYPLISAVHPLEVSDLNGDGKPDLIVANSGADSPDDSPNDSVSVLLNRGDGTFLARKEYAVPDAPDIVTVADLNGDHKPDFVTGGEDNNAVWVFLNRGDGTFGHRHSYRTPKNALVAAIAAGDLNGDGSADLAIANEARKGTVSVLLNRGHGTFRARRDLAVRQTPEDVTLVDLNGDGKLDIASADRTWDVRFSLDEQTLSVLENRGSGSFGARRDYLVGLDSIRPQLVDLNRDGRLDLATANTNGKGVSVRLAVPGLCNVQDVVGLTIQNATRQLARGGCRLGAVRLAPARRVRRGHVISERPAFGAVRPGGARIDLVVSG